MGIPPTRYKSYPHEFSGGMRQRLMIALALVLRPAFVVADEPTTALDVLVEAQIVRILNDLRRNFHTSLLLITHNVGIVAEACDRVAVMYAGRIVEQGEVDRRASRTRSTPTPGSCCARRSRCARRGSTSSRAHRRTWWTRRTAAGSTLGVPDAMNVCATKNPVDIERSGGGRVECWLAGPRGRRSRPAARSRSKQEELTVADEA